MSTIQTVLQGTLRSDGTLELDSRPNLPSGRVQVTLSLLDGSIMREIESQVAKLSRFAENWDGFGSPPVTREALTTATKLVRAIDGLHLPVPHICPVSGGGIGWTWLVGARRLVLEILPDGSLEYWASSGNVAEADEAERQEKEGSFHLDSGDAGSIILEQLMDWLRGE
jgi:hypothetical protein